jgi:hypothetical protein
VITRSWAWSPDPYNGALPPPLCFTIPDGVRTMMGPGYLATGGGLGVTLRRRKLMMDPSDSSTWQRPYRFT